ncbi:hypothetical protein [Alysiella filiformis]|nr:hypothetical protein [Alysiella filiformis]
MGKRWREGLWSSIPSPQPSPIGRGGKVTYIYQSFLSQTCINLKFS